MSKKFFHPYLNAALRNIHNSKYVIEDEKSNSSKYAKEFLKKLLFVNDIKVRDITDRGLNKNHGLGRLQIYKLISSGKIKLDTDEDKKFVIEKLGYNWEDYKKNHDNVFLGKNADQILESWNGESLAQVVIGIRNSLPFGKSTYTFILEFDEFLGKSKKSTYQRIEQGKSFSISTLNDYKKFLVEKKIIKSENAEILDKIIYTSIISRQENIPSDKGKIEQIITEVEKGNIDHPRIVLQKLLQANGFTFKFFERKYGINLLPNGRRWSLGQIYALVGGNNNPLNIPQDRKEHIANIFGYTTQNLFAEEHYDLEKKAKGTLVKLNFGPRQIIESIIKDHKLPNETNEKDKFLTVNSHLRIGQVYKMMRQNMTVKFDGSLLEKKGLTELEMGLLLLKFMNKTGLKLEKFNINDDWKYIGKGSAGEINDIAEGFIIETSNISAGRNLVKKNRRLRYKAIYGNA